MKELIGQNIQGYKIIQILGSGGMGIVYRAYDNNLERYVAIKFLESEIFDNPNIRERFKREAKNQAKLNHSNIVTVYGFLDYEGMLGIVAKALSKNSVERFKDCYEFKNENVKYEKLKDFSPTGTQTVEKKGIKKYAPIFFIVGFLAILLIIMNFIYKQVDEFLKSDTLEKMEKYNVDNFFKSNKQINLESLTLIETGTQANLQHINFVNENIGYIFGDSGLVLRTIDRKKWNKVKVVTSDSIDIINRRAIFASEFIEKGTAILVGQNGLALKSENLLQNISKMEINTTASLFDVEFIDNQLGFIVGSNDSLINLKSI